MSREGIIERLLRQAEARPDATAVEVLDGAKTSYRELVAEAELWRGRLRALGVGRGDAVAMMLPNSTSFIACTYALMSLGAVVVPLNPRWTVHELTPMLDDAEVVGVVAAPDCVAAALEAAADGAFIVVVGAPPPEGAPSNVVRFADVEGDREALVAPEGDPVVGCHFTFKGLGYPLGARHRYSAYALATDGYAAYCPQEVGDTHVVVLPMYPVFGFIGGIFLPLTHGGRIVLVDAKRASVRLLETLRATHVAAVPPILEMWLREAASLGRKLELHPRLHVTSGGSALGEATSDAFATIVGTEPYQGYGTTEVLLVCCNKRGAFLRGSIGVPLLDEIEVRIVDERGLEVPAGRSGGLAVRSGSVTVGYARRPRETHRYLRDGWFHTGDIAYIDAEGFVHFVGRRLPFAKVKAQMVDLVEIEAVLSTHPAVHAARVTVDSDGDDARVIASVMLSANFEADAATLRAHCESHLSRYKIPREFKIYERQVRRVPPTS